MTTAVEPVEAATSAWKPIMHWSCNLCNPEPYPGMKAICGAELLGMDPALGSDLCEVCGDREVCRDHYISVHGVEYEGD